MSPQPQTATGTGETQRDAERRRWARVPADAMPDVTAELTSGAQVSLVDVSLGGARFTTGTRMLPGLGVTLKFITSACESVVRGQIVRSALVNLAGGGPGYEVGVAFDEVLTGPIAEATSIGERTMHARPKEEPKASVPAPPPAVSAELAQLIDELKD